MSPYRRAVADPAFRRAVEQHYRGRHPVLDALRWFECDDADAGEGAPSPYAGLDGRRAALYRPGGDPAEAALVASLLAERDDERSAVRTAVEHADAALRERPMRRAEAAATRRRAWPVLLLAVPVAVAAFLGGSALAPAIGQRVEPLPSVAAAQTPTSVELAASPGGADAVFARDQQRSDVPIATPDGDLVAETFRRLAVLEGTGVVLYGARTTEGQVCLVAITIDAHITASCARDVDFRRTPASIDISVTKDPATDDPADTRTEVTATWWHDGTLRAGAVS
ncbi:MAG: hypothetical protein ACTHJL_09095 [Amnibacterium sp.]